MKSLATFLVSLAGTCSLSTIDDTLLIARIFIEFNISSILVGEVEKVYYVVLSSSADRNALNHVILSTIISQFVALQAGGRLAGSSPPSSLFLLLLFLSPPLRATNHDVLFERGTLSPRGYEGRGETPCSTSSVD